MIVLTCAVEVVCIIIDITTSMDEVSVDRFQAELSRSIGDLVWRGNEVATRQSSLRSRSSLHGALRGRLEIRWETGQWTRVTSSHRWRRGRQVVISHVSLGILAWVWAEVGGFIHINPQTVNVDASVGVEEVVELAIPVLRDVRVKPVGESSDTGPDNTCLNE